VLGKNALREAHIQIVLKLCNKLHAYRKNDFADKFENNFVETIKIMNNAAKNFDILATSFSVLHNYFDSSTKLLL